MENKAVELSSENKKKIWDYVIKTYTQNLEPDKQAQARKDWLDRRPETSLDYAELRIFFKKKYKLKLKSFFELGLKTYEEDKVNTKGNSSSTTITNITFTTFTTLSPCGDIVEDLVVEPIGNEEYVYCCKDQRGIAKAIWNNKKPSITILNKTYSFKGKPIKDLPYKSPSREIIDSWLKGDYKVLIIKEIYFNVLKHMKVLFDLPKPEYYTLLALAPFQSWLLYKLNAVFYIGFDATKGAGKTSLLEFITLINKHGVIEGDITYSAIARATHRYGLALAIDEIDQLPQQRKEECESILRKGQRRENFFLRTNPTTLEIEKFNVFGFHSYSFRDSVEDAFKHRTLLFRTKVSLKYELPILNYYKSYFGSKLQEQLFFNYITSTTNSVKRNSEKKSEVVKVMANIDGQNIKEIRTLLFKEFTKDFSEKELVFMKDLIGRNVELYFVASQVAHSIGIDLFEELKKSFESKQEEEEISDSYYLDLLQECLRELYYQNKDVFILQKGEFANCFYYPKTKVYGEFIKQLKDKAVAVIGTPKYNGLLKDIGFITGYNIKNQKQTKTPVLSLIYSKEIISNLNLNRLAKNL